jgi:hypothetical protein
MHLLTFHLWPCRHLRYKETQENTGGENAQQQQEPKEHSREKTQPDSTDQQHATSHKDPYVYTTRTPAAPSRHIATTHTSTKLQSEPQLQDPERKYRRRHTSTREDSTVAPVGTEGKPSTARQDVGTIPAAVMPILRILLLTSEA